MADGPNPTETRVLNDIARNTGDSDLLVGDDPNYVPVYKMIGDSKIPVSKKAGTLWKARKDAAHAKLEQNGKLASWGECIRYYKNDQKAIRGEAIDDTIPSPRQQYRKRRIGEYGGAETENIVFANTSSLVPFVYAKNPTCEITPNLRNDNQEGGADDDLARLSTTGERLVNALAAKKAAPGFNLKPKMRKAVIMTSLTNISYLEIGYTRREESSQQALDDLNTLAQRLTTAKDPQEIEEIEGELEALEETTDFLNPSGPWVKFRHPADVLRDPDSTSADLSDCKWVAIADYVSTSFLNAKYRKKVGDGDYASIYQPTHVAKAGAEGSIDAEINSFTIIHDKSDYRTYGYKDQYTYDKAQRTKVWYVWDKITRRVYMFNDKDWSWPIWVWDDLYNLEGFFPLYPLEFYTDPEEDIANSEVSYYLDQQDAINEINDELAFIRRWVKRNLFFNKSVINERDMETYLNGHKVGLGLDVQKDTDIQKAIFALPPPSAQFMQMFNKQAQLEAIGRLSSVDEVMQGAQFKTNTTEDAVQTYNSRNQTRMDEKIDAIEDCVGNVFWGILQMCLQFMTIDEVTAVLGPNQAWDNLSPEDIRVRFNVRVTGGSTQKPTSQVKKEEALKIGQILGQYANAGQGAVILMMLKVMESAFDELVISTEDWQFLQQSIMQTIQNSNPQGQPQGGGAEGAAPPQSSAGGLPPEVAQVLGQIDSLPPEAKKALGDAMSQGVPVVEAVQRVIALTQQAGGQA